jgi:hypothetical protein
MDDRERMMGAFRISGGSNTGRIAKAVLLQIFGSLLVVRTLPEMDIIPLLLLASYHLGWPDPMP